MKVKSNFNNIDYSKDISSIDFGETNLDDYGAKTIEYAKRLKAQYGDKYTDEFYLSYAQGQMSLKSIKKASLHTSKHVNKLPFDDPKWANFTYEEIIMMNENGSLIPKEVLAWAYAQQECDNTSYVVISDDISLDELEALGEFGNTNNIIEFRKNTQKGISLAQRKNEQIIDDSIELQKISEQINNIKQGNTNPDKSTELQRKNEEREFEELNNKQKTSQLTDQEIQRLKYLNNKLKSPQKTNKNLDKDSLILKDLLRSADNLKQNSETNTKISEAAINAAEYYTEIEAPLAPLQRNYSVNNLLSLKFENPLGTTNNSIINLSNTVAYNLDGNNQTFLTSVNEQIQTGSQMPIESTDSTSQNNRIDTNKLEIQKQDETQTEIEDKTQAGNTNEEPQETEQQEELNNNSQNQNTTNATQFIPSNEPALTLMQGHTTLDDVKKLKEQSTSTNKTKTNTKKDIQKTEQDLRKSEKNINTELAKHNKNVEQRETLALEHENINQEAENNTNADEQNEIQGKSENITTDIEALQSEDDASIDSLNNDLTTQKRNSKKLPQAQKDLKTNNTDLNKLSNYTKTTSGITLSSGILTSTGGGLNMLQGLPMLITGTNMMSNPFTFSAGIALVNIATKLITLGSAQLVSGPYAIAAGTTGLSESSNADNEVKEGNSEIKANDKSINNINSDIDNLQEEISSESDVKVTPPTQNQKQENEDTQQESDNTLNEQSLNNKNNLNINSNKQIIQDTEQEKDTNTDTTIAAASTTNSNITERTSNSDKEDRKLTRFNNDSIIESKRKRNRVTAISSARGGTV